MYADLPPQPPALVAYVDNKNGRRPNRGTGSGQRPELKFVTLTGEIEKVLPDNKNGFGHQRFVFHNDTAGSPTELEVDNDITFGHRIPDIKVGEKLEIRGVLWHDAPRGNKPARDGIHWTHHRKKTGDAGWIKTPDGHTYE